MEIRVIGKLQISINQGIHFALPQGAQTTCSSVMLHLLNLTRNCLINKLQQLSILQQLTSLISLLVQFTSPVCYLARFDRLRFRKECMKSTKNIILDQMIRGIYPPRKVTQAIKNSLTFQLDIGEDALQQIGNINWKLTRNIISVYHKSASRKHQEILEVLLAMPQLRDKIYMTTQWRSLWTELYLMTNSILVSQVQNYELKQQENGESWLARLKQVMAFTLQSHHQKNEQTTFVKIILKLVVCIIKKFIFKKQQNDLKELDLMFTLLRQRNFSQLYTYLISFMLIKDIFQRCGLKDASNHYQQKLNSFVYQNEISSISSHIDADFVQNQKEAIILKSYLLSHQELPEFLFNNGLNFWDYGLNQNELKKLAEKYLLKAWKFDYDFQWQKVFEYLSPKAFAIHILKAGKKWISQPWTPHLLSSKAQSLINHQKFPQISSQITLQLLKTTFHQFCSQWELFSIIEKKGIKKSLSQAESLLTFNFKLNKKLLKFFVFPQKDSQYFVSLLQNYLKTITKENLIQENYHLFFRPELTENLSRIEDHMLDNYWALWADLLINKDSTLQTLLQIQNKTQIILQKQKTQLVNDRLQLKPE